MLWFMQKYTTTGGPNITLRLCKDTDEEDEDEEEEQDIDTQTVFKLKFLDDAHETNYHQAHVMRLTTHLQLAVLR